MSIPHAVAMGAMNHRGKDEDPKHRPRRADQIGPRWRPVGSSSRQARSTNAARITVIGAMTSGAAFAKGHLPPENAPCVSA